MSFNPVKESSSVPSLLDDLKSNLNSTIYDALDDANVTTIMLNPDGQLWIDRLGKGVAPCGELDLVTAENIIRNVSRITDIPGRASFCCEWPIGGGRFEALVPPITARPAFIIYKNPKMLTLEECLENHFMLPFQFKSIQWAIAERLNFLICGAPGSGKTRLANAILDAMIKFNPQQRIAVVEEKVTELHVQTGNVLALKTNDLTDMAWLLKSIMRWHPNRIVVGEVNDSSALALIKAWNAGTSGGITTINAHSCDAALVRMRQFLEEAAVPKNLCTELIEQTIGVVISVVRTEFGWKIGQLCWTAKSLTAANSTPD